MRSRAGTGLQVRDLLVVGIAAAIGLDEIAASGGRPIVETHDAYGNYYWLREAQTAAVPEHRTAWRLFSH